MPIDETGSVTAELAITLPAVIATLLIAVSALSLQLQRIELGSRAALVARAVARGEPADSINSLMRPGELIRQNQLGQLSCVTLSRPIKLAVGALDISAEVCARTGGL